MLAAGLHGNGMFGRLAPATGPGRPAASGSRRPTWKHVFFIRDRLRNARALQALESSVCGTRRLFGAFVYIVFPVLTDF